MNKSNIFQFNNIKVSHKIDEIVADKSSYRSHSHPFYELLFFVDGDIEYVIENTRFRLVKNSGVLTRSTQFHYVNFISRKNYERYVIKFTPEVLPDNLRRTISGCGTYFTVTDPNTLGLFKKFDYYAEKYPEGSLHELYISIIIELLYEISHYFDVTPKEVVNEKITDILTYINNNLASEITLDLLCQQFYQSKTWLYNAFMEALHVSPIRYIESKRLKLANELIRSGEKPTKIFLLCGFSDYSTFYRAYRKYYGHAPTYAE